MERFPQVSAPMNLPSGQGKSKLQKVLDDRMMISEAISLAGQLLELFPSAKKDISDGFIGALAAILADYPRQISQKCIHPKNGLAGEAVFISVAGLIGWLERQTEALREQADYEIRVDRQIEARESWHAETPTDRLKAAGRAWLERSDPIAQKLSGQREKGILARAARERLIHEHGREKFDSIPNS